MADLFFPPRSIFSIYFVIQTVFGKKFLEDYAKMSSGECGRVHFRPDPGQRGRAFCLGSDFPADAQPQKTADHIVRGALPAGYGADVSGDLLWLPRLGFRVLLFGLCPDRRDRGDLHDPDAGGQFTGNDHAFDGPPERLQLYFGRGSHPCWSDCCWIFLRRKPWPRDNPSYIRKRRT